MMNSMISSGALDIREAPRNTMVTDNALVHEMNEMDQYEGLDNNLTNELDFAENPD